jgi:diguanylate cyclase (GGDEF)-like protein
MTSFATAAAPATTGDPDALTPESILEMAPEALVALDGGGTAVFANRAAHHLGDRAPELGAALRGEVPLRRMLLDLGRVDDDVRQGGESDVPLTVTCAFETTSLETLWVSAKLGARQQDGTEPGSLVCSLRDITGERAREEALTHYALHDPLTGLPNRRLLDEHLQLAVARARRGEHCVGVLFLDLNGLKRVNDTLGHQVGDELLIEFATRVSGAVRASDPVGRLTDWRSMVGRQGGDEFVVVLTDLGSDPAEIMRAVTSRLERALHDPLVVAGRELSLSAAVGSDARTLLERANSAMRQMKS